MDESREQEGKGFPRTSLRMHACVEEDGCMCGGGWYLRNKEAKQTHHQSGMITRGSLVQFPPCRTLVEGWARTGTKE